MRFRRRIKIMKGLNLNLSKSGLSVSAGVRGASVTMGKKGSYLNTGIPGTGIYNRTKLGSSSSSQKYTNKNLQIPEEKVQVSIGLDEKGNPTLTITDSTGRPITDETILRRVKRSEKYKQSVDGLIEAKKLEIDEETNKFINISKYTPEIIIESVVRDEFETLKPQTYVSQEYTIQIPTKEIITQELAVEAKEKIKNILFWKNKKLRETYIFENLESRFQLKVDEWTKSKQLFIETENANKVAKDKEFYEDYAVTKKEFQEVLQGDTNYVTEKIEAILSDIILPVEFSVSYEYHPELNQLKIDLDLPEIENMPQDKANVLSSGKISIKQKTQKELKQQYSQCVSGISFYLGGTFFNISTAIKEILISGYTQRTNKATGIIEDQYIYSLKLTRDKFSSLNFEKVDPIEAFSNFENNRILSSSYDFKTIVPW
jgi:hypothetical protein